MNHLLNHTGLNLEAKLLASAHLLPCVNSWQILKFLWHQNGNSNFILKLIWVDRLNLACLNLVSTWRQYLNYMCLNCLHTGCCPHWNTKMAKCQVCGFRKKLDWQSRGSSECEPGRGGGFTFEWSYFGNLYSEQILAPCPRPGSAAVVLAFRLIIILKYHIFTGAQ